MGEECRGWVLGKGGWHDGRGMDMKKIGMRWVEDVGIGNGLRYRLGMGRELEGIHRY
jgi:hypothetical protein